MTDLTEFTPVVGETIATVRTRLDADANSGLDPSDPRWIDTTHGGIYWDLTQVIALEQERLWDTLGIEIPAAMFPEYAWGVYLDEHAFSIGLLRRDAASAGAIVRFTGAVGTGIGTGTQVATEPSDPDAEPQVFATTAATASGGIPASGYVDLPVVASEAGSAGNVGVGLITQLMSPIAGISGVANTSAATGGADIEDDESLRARILQELGASVGAGTVADYVRWSLAEPGVGYVTVNPLWNGPGTVQVVVTDPENAPVPTSVLTSLQTRLDPPAYPAQGQGLAPIGALVTVTTPQPLYVDVAATIVFDGGYSLDGAGGTVAAGAAIAQSISDYITGLATGAEVVLNAVEAAAMKISGVHDITGTTLGGYIQNPDSSWTTNRAPGPTNLPVPSAPTPRTAMPRTITLS